MNQRMHVPHKKIHRPRPSMSGGNNRPRTESKNVDNRSRGTLQQLEDKYLAMARDATSSGDRVAAEGFFQHADHYHRLVQALNETQQQQNHHRIQREQQQQHHLAQQQATALQQQPAAEEAPTSVLEAIGVTAETQAIDTKLVEPSSPESEIELALS